VSFFVSEAQMQCSPIRLHIYPNPRTPAQSIWPELLMNKLANNSPSVMN